MSSYIKSLRDQDGYISLRDKHFEDMNAFPALGADTNEYQQDPDVADDEDQSENDQDEETTPAEVNSIGREERFNNNTPNAASRLVSCCDTEDGLAFNRFAAKEIVPSSTAATKISIAQSVIFPGISTIRLAHFIQSTGLLLHANTIPYIKIVFGEFLHH